MSFLAIGVFIILLAMRVPISLVLGIMTVTLIFLSGNTNLLASAPQRLFSGVESYGLLAIPLFMLAGELMNSGGITTRLVRFAKVAIGHYKGGLAVVNVVANMFLASIVGSSNAQIAMMSRVMVPEMEKEGYDRSFASSTTAAASLLGPIIPPSMLFIIYGVTAGQSIGTMFLAGIVPGLILGVGFISFIIVIGYTTGLPYSEKQSPIDFIKAFFEVLPSLLIPTIILVGILAGIFTPTESAAFACAIAVLIGLFYYKELKIKDFPSIMVNTAITTATVTLLIAMANMFGWVLTFEHIPQAIADGMTTITENPLLFLLFTNIFLLLVGMVLDGIAALIILVPIFMPLLSTYDIDPVHFGVIICINLALGLLTPPVGAGLFIASSIGEVKFEDLSKQIMPFVGLALVVLLVLTYFPFLVTWLPDTFMKI